jgi:type II secretory pathway predicted ATPase ExeA/ankyrin repeat protein
MVGDAFGVGQEPFGISPDPRFTYFDPKLRRNHQALLDGLRAGIGLAVVAGERGIGKTMLLHCLASELDVADHVVVQLSCLGSPSAGDIVGAFAVQIGCSGQSEGGRDAKGQPSLASMLASSDIHGTTAVLLLDDADGLTEETLSKLLAMSGKRPKVNATVSIVLAGSPDLAARLRGMGGASSNKHPDLMVALGPLAMPDVEAYILHRLYVAGFEGPRVFTPEAIGRVARHARGNPQAINRICRAAMVVAASQSRKTVSADVVDEVAPNGGGERSPGNGKAGNGRQLPRTDAGPESDRKAVGAAGLPLLGGLPRSEADAPAFAAADLAAARGMADDVRDTREGFEPEMPSAPSGWDMTARMSRDTEEMKTPPPARGHRKWVAVGGLAAVAALALYLVVGGESNEAPSARALGPSSTETAAGMATRDRLADTRPANSLAGEAPVPDTLATSEPGEAPPPERWKPLLEKAVSLGDTALVEKLLDAGADINAPVAGGKTPLAVAAGDGDETMVRLLLDRGADPSSGTADDLAFDADALFPELDPPAKSKFSMAAGPRDATLGEGLAESSNAKLRRELLLSTVGDGQRPLNGLQPRAGADASSHSAGMQERVARGRASDVTPLIAAASGGHAKVTGVLLAAGAEVNAVDVRGRTPLMAAVDAGDRESAELLLARGGDIHAVDVTGRSAMDIARQKNRQDIVQLLSARSGPVSAQAPTSLLSAKATQTNAEGAETTRLPSREPSRAEKRPAPGGMKDRARVTQVQRSLRDLGYDPGPVDGVAGSRTKSAIIAFQQKRGITADGNVTENLMRSLAAEAQSREARQLAAEIPAKGPQPERPGFFGSILSGLQNLRGLDFNSVEDPAGLRKYCASNLESWVYDRGTERSVFCKQHVKAGSL